MAHMKKISAAHSERVSCTARDGHVNVTDALGIDTANPGFYILIIHCWLLGNVYIYIYMCVCACVGLRIFSHGCICVYYICLWIYIMMSINVPVFIYVHWVQTMFGLVDMSHVQLALFQASPRTNEEAMYPRKAGRGAWHKS